MLLAVAVVEVWALYHWGAAVSSAEAAEALAPVADGAALAAALIFSTLLAAMYLPVGLLHTKWLNAVVELESRHTQQLDVEKWLARWGIKSSAVSIGTAVVLPAIAFILTTLLKRAIGATQSG